ncbi:MAG: hypothetical protein AB7S52_02860 [Sphaerochaetaceae bacterium]
MKKSLVIGMVVIILAVATGCASFYYASDDGSMPDAEVSDGTVSARLEIRGDDKVAKVVFTNESDSIVEIAWPKASYKGGSLIASRDAENPNAQPIPASLLPPGATVMNFVLPKNSAMFVSGRFYKQWSWGERYESGDFVFAYTVGGKERFITL